MTLTEFLAARLDEDEAAAKAAEGRPGTVIVPSHVATHVTRHDPARVLREVEAGRKILAAWQDNELERPSDDAITYTDGLADGLGLAVHYLAAVWSDHPDYDDALRP